MVRPEQVWAGLAFAGLSYEAYGLFGDVEGDTLSEVIRAVFHTEHPAGKAAFVVTYVGFGVWFVPHIVGKESGQGRDRAHPLIRMVRTRR